MSNRPIQHAGRTFFPSESLLGNLKPGDLFRTKHNALIHVVNDNGLCTSVDSPFQSKYLPETMPVLKLTSY